jgi:hypothetical protein
MKYYLFIAERKGANTFNDLTMLRENICLKTFEKVVSKTISLAHQCLFFFFKIYHCDNSERYIIINENNNNSKNAMLQILFSKTFILGRQP